MARCARGRSAGTGWRPGRLFQSVDEMRSTSAALIRTGFLILSQDLVTSVDVVFSPAMREFAELAEFETFEADDDTADE